MSKPDYLKYDGRKPEPPYETEQSESSTPLEQDSKLLDAAVAFRESLVSRADEMRHGTYPLWHGWAIYDAFVAGARFARSESGETVSGGTPRTDAAYDPTRPEKIYQESCKLERELIYWKTRCQAADRTANSALSATGDSAWTMDAAAILDEWLVHQYGLDVGGAKVIEDYLRKSLKVFRTGDNMKQHPDSSWVRVPFKLSTALGYETFYVWCPYAPTLTASGMLLKDAAQVPANYGLHFCADAVFGNRAVHDDEAVQIQPDGSSQFIGVPPACF